MVRVRKQLRNRFDTPDCFQGEGQDVDHLCEDKELVGERVKNEAPVDCATVDVIEEIARRSTQCANDTMIVNHDEKDLEFFTDGSKRKSRGSGG